MPVGLFQLLLVLALGGVALWALGQFPAMDATIKQIIKVIIVVILAVMVIYFLFGLVGAAPTFRLSR